MFSTNSENHQLPRGLCSPGNTLVILWKLAWGQPTPLCPEGFTVTAILAAQLPTLLSEPLQGGPHGTFGTGEEVMYEDWGGKGALAMTFDMVH